MEYLGGKARPNELLSVDLSVADHQRRVVWTTSDITDVDTAQHAME